MTAFYCRKPLLSKTKFHIYIYVYIYIYMCVCVCGCVSVYVYIYIYLMRKCLSDVNTVSYSLYMIFKSLWFKCPDTEVYIKNEYLLCKINYVFNITLQTYRRTYIYKYIYYAEWNIFILKALRIASRGKLE